MLDADTCWDPNHGNYLLLAEDCFPTGESLADDCLVQFLATVLRQSSLPIALSVFRPPDSSRISFISSKVESFCRSTSLLMFSALDRCPRDSTTHSVCAFGRSVLANMFLFFSTNSSLKVLSPLAILFPRVAPPSSKDVDCLTSSLGESGRMVCKARE